MNYKKIYENFIADRKTKNVETIYSEIHHIIPRCMSGGNKKENLIRLTYEDHFFAHLLLAKAYDGHKIYGPKLWRTVFMMSGESNEREATTRTRRLYAMVRFEAVRKCYENSDQQIRKWKHKNGEEFEGTNLELSIHTGLKNVFFLATGDMAAHQVYGWYLADKYSEYPSQSFLMRNNAPVYSLKDRNGNILSGSQIELSEKIGCLSSSISRVISGEKHSIKGWILPENDFRTIRRGGIATLVHDDGRKFTGKSDEFAKLFPDESKHHCYKAGFTRIKKGTISKMYGWSLA